MSMPTTAARVEEPVDFMRCASSMITVSQGMACGRNSRNKVIQSKPGQKRDRRRVGKTVKQSGGSGRSRQAGRLRAG